MVDMGADGGDLRRVESDHGPQRQDSERYLPCRGPDLYSRPAYHYELRHYFKLSFRMVQ